MLLASARYEHFYGTFERFMGHRVVSLEPGSIGHAKLSHSTQKFILIKSRLVRDFIIVSTAKIKFIR